MQEEPVLDTTAIVKESRQLREEALKSSHELRVNISELRIELGTLRQRRRKMREQLAMKRLVSPLLPRIKHDAEL